MIRSGLITMIREKSDKGKSAYAISKEMGIAENTAKKYIDNRGKALKHGLSGQTKGSKLDPFKLVIQNYVSQGILNCIVIFERLQEQGYDGGITIIKDYIKPFRPLNKGKAVERYETLPGKQAQMDWGIVHYIDGDGKSHKTPAFIMIMGNSRAKYVEFTKRCDYYSLVRCMLNAFEYFGGVPETILTDHMKTVVIRIEAKTPIFHARFSEFAADMGFVPKLCRVRRPQTKGKVERLVHYVKDNFLPGRKFVDLEDLNNQALRWCKKVDSRMHGTTGEIPLMALAKEPLLSLPESSTRDRYRWEIRKVTRDGFVSYDGVRYGVSWQYSNREVRVRALNGNFEVYDGEVRLLCRKIEYTSGKIIFLKGQYQGLAEKEGVAFPMPYGILSNQLVVEKRSLDFYDEVMGVRANG
jgi:transposase